MDVHLIDELLEKMALEGRNHFAPHYVCQRLNLPTSAIHQVGDYMLTLVNHVLMPLYEVECPNEHIDYWVTDVSKLDLGLRTCEECGEVYTPDPSHIWLSFNFTDSYLQYVKKNLISAWPRSATAREYLPVV